MTYAQRLWRSEVAGIGALLACATVVAMIAFADAVRIGPTSLMSSRWAASAGFAYTVAIGALPAILYGAPLYALLAHKGRATWPAVIVLGMAPGLLVLPFDPWVGGWALVCGVVVAGVTHVLMKRWIRRSNSALLTDAYPQALRASSGAAKRER